MGANLSYPTVDLSGKVVVVTGANTGIGYETAKALAVMGAHTIFACRSQQRTAEALDRLRREVAEELPNRNITVESMPLDLSSFQSTQQFVAAFKERNLPLHILINNAGIALVPEGRTGDGYELQFQVNHLSHFLLTLELLPSLLETASSTGDGRIIFVSSAAHKYGTFNLENMNGEQQYGRGHFYGNSKLYNIMTAFALQRRLKNVGITVSSLHPGAVKTELIRGAAGESKGLLWLGQAVTSLPVFRSAKEGAATTLNCAVNPELNSQQSYYYESCRQSYCTPLSRDEAIQEQLWDISINIVKDYLSPEVLEKYGPVQQPGFPCEQGDHSGEQPDQLNCPPSKQADQSDQETDQQTGGGALDPKHSLSGDSNDEP